MVIEAIWYPVFLIMVMIVVHLVTRHREKEYRLALGDVVLDLKDMIFQEEIKVVRDGLTNSNELTLTSMLTYTPNQGDYDKVLNLLVTLAKRRFDEYKFLLAKSSDETTDTNFLQIVSNWTEDPELHREIFKGAIDANLDMKELREQFAQLVAIGEVINLGDGVIVIVDDNTGNPPTGVSPINSGLEGGEIAFIISFIKEENYAAWAKNTFPEEEETETNE
ncbi:hypothetical protein CPT_Moonbeam32 [Bacillus phage Moonbeam]|uniref:Uncharacterized protein n=1 Tax=Bacillus phage Moonbeam TaxID=1540091 RepID=A0A0A0RMY5_9CAUD|nr:hypothetical protein CPT_Moonbeam32 [Bacillus phage Moonbeam]AIW03430.1 hypothetical protein CPT_Moonbeam32 [Bacillus phage Moonbeam]